MRTTPVLYATHIGRKIKYKWFWFGRLQVKPSDARKVLADNNIKLYKPEELLEPPPLPPLRENPLIPEELPLDKNHPDWKAEPCYIYRDNDVLLEGLDQARALINCVEVPNLPSSLIDLKNKIKVPDHVHKEAMRKILQSCVWDAYQEKLPKRKDPARPAYTFPRDYGITDVRKNKLLLNNLVQLCDQHFGTSDKVLMNDGLFKLTKTMHNKLIQFELSSEIIIRAKNKLQPTDKPVDEELKPVPNMYPIDCTVSLQPYHFYSQKPSFSIAGTKWPSIQTLFFSFNKTEVKNLFEEEVYETQMLGRNLLKGFTAAGCQAFASYGVNVKKLISPIVVQLVMTDGRFFHFSMFQLNTLDFEDKEMKNIYWNSPIIPLYEKCEYYKGVPTLDGYNPEIMNMIVAFYKNQ